LIKVYSNGYVQSNLQHKINNSTHVIIIRLYLKFDNAVLMILMCLSSWAVIKCWQWERWHTKICNPNDIYT